MSIEMRARNWAKNIIFFEQRPWMLLDVLNEKNKIKYMENSLIKKKEDLNNFLIRISAVQ